MAGCDLRVSCFFFNDMATDMPHTTDYLRNLYCTGACYAECALYRISKVYGKDKVPKYLYPNDMYEILNFNLFEPDGGLDMFLKVIYPDGASGMVKASMIDRLRKTGEIIAFHCSEGWVDVRRKIKISYSGSGRRRIKPEEFFAKF